MKQLSFWDDVILFYSFIIWHKHFFSFFSSIYTTINTNICYDTNFLKLHCLSWLKPHTMFLNECCNTSNMTINLCRFLFHNSKREGLSSAIRIGNLLNTGKLSVSHGKKTKKFWEGDFRYFKQPSVKLDVFEENFTSEILTGKLKEQLTAALFFFLRSRM